MAKHLFVQYKKIKYPFSSVKYKAASYYEYRQVAEPGVEKEPLVKMFTEKYLLKKEVAIQNSAQQ